MFRWFENKLDPFPAEEPVEPPRAQDLGGKSGAQRRRVLRLEGLKPQGPGGVDHAPHRRLAARAAGS
jgi:hypothetical protein